MAKKQERQKFMCQRIFRTSVNWKIQHYHPMNATSIDFYTLITYTSYITYNYQKQPPVSTADKTTITLISQINDYNERHVQYLYFI